MKNSTSHSMKQRWAHSLLRATRQKVSLFCFLSWILAGGWYPSPALAQSTPSFGAWSLGSPYEGLGYNPVVATNGSTVVELHNGSNTPGPMWFRVGQFDYSKNPPPVTWGNNGNSTEMPPNSNGYNPSVAMYGSTVVELHDSGTSTGPMWYRVGQLNAGQLNGNNPITWGTPIEMPSFGYNPSVAMYGLTVVEMHGGTSPGPIWYRIGHVNSYTINWGPLVEIPASTGYSPSVALYGSTVVEVHNNSNLPDNLWYRVGQINANGYTISWGTAQIYDWGFNPKVSMSNCFSAPYVVEVHDGSNQADNLWFHFGLFSGPTTIQFGNGIHFEWGWNPTVATSYPAAVEVHNGAFTPAPLWINTAEINPPNQ